MNKYLSAKLVSNELVVTEAENNQETIDKIPAFAEGIVALKANNTKMREAMLLQEQSTTGVTAQKEQARTLLVDYVIDVAGGIHALAESKNDTVLMAKVDYPATRIERLGLSQLITTASSILALAKTIAADQLAHFGITAEETAAFETALTRFESLKTSPKEAIIEHSQYTDTIAALQDESQQILDMLDKLATQFKRKAPVYYDVYATTRKANLASSRKKSDSTTSTTTTGETKV